MSEHEKPLIPITKVGKLALGVGLGALGAYSLQKLQRRVFKPSESISDLEPILPVNNQQNTSEDSGVNSLDNSSASFSNWARSNLTNQALGYKLGRLVAKHAPEETADKVLEVADSLVHATHRPDLAVEAQLASAKARLYLYEIELPKKAVAAYYGKRGERAESKLPKEVVTSAFEDLFTLDGDPEAIKRFRKDFGDAAFELENIASSIKQSFGQKEEEYLARAQSHELGIGERIDMPFKLIFKIPTLDPDQQTALLNRLGYPEDYISKLYRKVEISAGVSTGFFFSQDVITDFIGLFGGGALAYLTDSLSVLSREQLRDVALLSAAAYYTTLGLQMEQSLRFSKDERAEFNTNPTLVLAHESFRKIFADKPLLVEVASRLGFYINPFVLWSEKWWLTYFAEKVVFTVGNISAISILFGQYLGYEGAYRTEIALKEKLSKKADTSTIKTLEQKDSQ